MGSLKFSIREHPRRPQHATVSGVKWTPQNELLFVSDSQALHKWTPLDAGGGTSESDSHLGVVTQLCDLSTFATDLDLLNAQRGSALVADVCLFGCSDGTMRITSAQGRLEKTEKAHTGAVISVCWSPDGSALLTGGEDGLVKQWSRSGHLRSKLAAEQSPIHIVQWAPVSQAASAYAGQSSGPSAAAQQQQGGSDAIIYAHDRCLTIKPLAVNSRVTRWIAHEAPVLCLDWSNVNGLIVSGSEECKYKIWTREGQCLYTSRQAEFAITSVKWNRTGTLFSVGSFQSLMLCDASGFVHDRQRTRIGSAVKQDWSLDNSSLVVAGANGTIATATISDQEVTYGSIAVRLAQSQLLHVFDALNPVTDSSTGAIRPNDQLETSHRVIDLSYRYQHLIVMTQRQCCIYSNSNWHTPIQIDLKSGGQQHALILQSPALFALINRQSGMSLYSYDGKQVNPAVKLSASSLAALSCISPLNTVLCDDLIVTIDSRAQNILHFLDVDAGTKSMHDDYKHSSEIISISVSSSLSGAGGTNERLIALIDRNSDCYLVQLVSTLAPGATLPCVKLSGQVTAACFSDTSSLVNLLSGSQLVTFYYPQLHFVDRDLVHYTKHVQEIHAQGSTRSATQRIGRLQPQVGTTQEIRLQDGTVIALPLLYEATTRQVQRLCSQQRWVQASRLCRLVHESVEQHCCYAILASAALAAQQLDIAECALAPLDEVDKVHYIQSVKSIPSVEGRSAELQLFRHQTGLAEQILLHADLVYRAIELNMSLSNWSRALEIAIKHKQHIDTVLAHRIRHLQASERHETEPVFIKYNEQYAAHLDWQVIETNARNEREKEQRRGGQYKTTIPDLSISQGSTQSNQKQYSQDTQHSDDVQL